MMADAERKTALPALLFISLTPRSRGSTAVSTTALHSTPPECQAQVLTTSYLEQLLQVNAEFLTRDILSNLIILN